MGFFFLFFFFFFLVDSGGLKTRGTEKGIQPYLVVGANASKRVAQRKNRAILT